MVIDPSIAHTGAERAKVIFLIVSLKGLKYSSLI